MAKERYGNGRDEKLYVQSVFHHKSVSAPLEGIEQPDGQPGDALRALSVHYLSTGLQKELRAVGLTPESSIRDLEKHVIRPFGESTRCPRDGRMGSAFVDAISGEDKVGKANFMLSYTWDYRIGDVVDTLVHYCSKHGLNPKRSYVWICAFCVNQHRVQEALSRNETVPFEKFAEEFGSRVRGIRHVLALMGPWHAPAYVNRAWCLYELATAMDIEDCKLEILMPPREACGFTKAFTSSPNSITDLRDVLGRVCVAMAEATVRSDKVSIMRAIHHGPGLIALNNRLRAQLQCWFAEVAEAEARMLLRRMELCDSVATNSIANVSHVLAELGRTSSATALVRACLAKASDFSVLKSAGHVFSSLGDHETALEYFRQALASLEDPQTEAEKAGPGPILMAMGAIKVRQGKTAHAMQHFSNACDVLKASGPLQRISALMDLALVQADLKDYQGMAASYLQLQELHKTSDAPIVTTATGAVMYSSHMDNNLASCKELYSTHEKQGLLCTAGAAHNLTAIAYIQGRCALFQAAATTAEAALKLHKAAGTLVTPFGADTLATLATMRERLQDFSGAAVNKQQALEIRQGLGLPADCTVLPPELCQLSPCTRSLLHTLRETEHEREETVASLIAEKQHGNADSPWKHIVSWQEPDIKTEANLVKRMKHVATSCLPWSLLPGRRWDAALAVQVA